MAWRWRPAVTRFWLHWKVRGTRRPGIEETLRAARAAVTVIEPGTADTVVTCAEGARLDGFTVRGGLALNTAAVGCSDASPKIVNNWIFGIGGIGVSLQGSRNGEIAHNRIWGDPSFNNGGCPCSAVVASGGVRIHHNEIYAADTNGNAEVIEIADYYRYDHFSNFIQIT